MNKLFVVLAAVFGATFGVHLPTNIALTSVNGRIVNGTIAKNSDARFMVQIYYDTAGQSFVCGGSLISRRTVLTASHCVTTSDSYFIQYGSTNRFNETYSTTVTKTIKHPDYSSKTLDNDIALLIIKPIRYNNDVDRVKLQKKAIKNNTNVTLFGFGAQSSRWVTDDLYKTNLIATGGEDCMKFLDSQRMGRFGKICAYSPTSASCYGDSGSPVVVTDTKKQVGIVSYGNANCNVNSWAVYTNVTYYKDWITQNMKY